MVEFTKAPLNISEASNKPVYVFNVDFDGENADKKTIESFGDEWKKFHNFPDSIIAASGAKYFDIVTDKMLNSNSYVLDIGCGTGRWTKFIHKRAGFVEAVEPSDAIFFADILLKNVNNVRLTKASIDNLPFPDDCFDFGMAIGVFHYIPDPYPAIHKCIKKIKSGGYFYAYMYYNLENRGLLFRSMFQVTNLIRKAVSSLPSKTKRITCDVLAYTLYVPLVYAGKILNKTGMQSLAKKLPLSRYQTAKMFTIRNDALNRFGTPIETRFSKKEIYDMMTKCGLTDIVFSNNIPYYHVVGRKN